MNIKLKLWWNWVKYRLDLTCAGVVMILGIITDDINYMVLGYILSNLAFIRLKIGDYDTN